MATLLAKTIIFFPPTYKLNFSVLIKLPCSKNVKTFINSLGELSEVAGAVFRDRGTKASRK